MSLFGNLFKTFAPSLLGGLFGGGGTVSPSSSIQTNVPGLVNTPQLLANAASSMNLGGNFFNSIPSSLFGGGNTVSPVDVGGSGNFYGSLYPVNDPVSPINYSAGNPIFGNVPGLLDTAGLLANASSLFGGGGGGTPQAQLPPPPVQDPVNIQGATPPPTNIPGLVNTPGILDAAGQIINGTSQTGGQQQGYDWQKFLQTIVGAGGLGALLNGQQNDLGPDADKLRAMAGDISGQRGRLMETSLANQQGMLNDQALNAIERRLRKSEAGMRGKYAEMGMSGSTMEQEDLADLRAKAQDEVFASAQEMAVTGLQTAAQMTGQESTIYQVLMNAQIQKDQELGRVLAEFAAASAK